MSLNLSTDSTIVFNAVSKPIVKSLQVISLSIVPGIPTTVIPSFDNSYPPNNVPLPPITTTVSIFLAFKNS